MKFLYAGLDWTPGEKGLFPCQTHLLLKCCDVITESTLCFPELISGVCIKPINISRDKDLLSQTPNVPFSKCKARAQPVY